MVGPTEKPSSYDLFKRTRFTKKLLPVLYLPTIDITARGTSSDRPNYKMFDLLSKNYLASGLISNLPLYLIKGIA